MPVVRKTRWLGERMISRPSEDGFAEWHLRWPPLRSDALHSDVLIPEQFFTLAHHSAAHWSGARRLLLAALQDAVACWFRSCGARSLRGRRQFQETHAWFWAQDRHWLFAFERICEHLNSTRTTSAVSSPAGRPLGRAGNLPAYGRSLCLASGIFRWSVTELLDTLQQESAKAAFTNSDRRGRAMMKPFTVQELQPLLASHVAP